MNWALKLLEEIEGTIYIDSKYAFGVVQTFGKIWDERGLINSKGKELVHEELSQTSLGKPTPPKGNGSSPRKRTPKRGILWKPGEIG